MSSAKRLQPVADVARHAERSAARQHGDALRDFQKQQHQLDELIEYRNQYVQRFQDAGRQGLSIVQMRDYQTFITRLDNAIAQQQQQVMNGQQKSEASQQEWAGKRSRSKMIDKVVANRSDAEQQHRRRREQREMDDRVHEGGAQPTGGG